MASEQTGYGGSGPSGPRAGFWIRFGAVLIDGIGLGIISFALRAGIGAAGEAVGILIALLYYTYFEGSGAGQTIGKKLVGIRVIDFNTGGPIGYGRAALRYVGSYVSGLALLLGYLWMIWDGEKQTWHDKWSSSVVVPVSSYPVERWPG
ncbi:MAG: RDD family protein [Gaiellales bacterium]